MACCVSSAPPHLSQRFPLSAPVNIVKINTLRNIKGQLKRLMELKAPMKRNTELINVMF